jgi:hypothetical protein
MKNLTLYNFDTLGLQLFDTVEVFDSKKEKSWKGFFLGFGTISYGSKFETLGFKNVVLFINNYVGGLRASEDIITKTKHETFYLKVFHTRMVLTEKFKFKQDEL